MTASAIAMPAVSFPWIAPNTSTVRPVRAPVWTARIGLPSRERPTMTSSAPSDRVTAATGVAGALAASISR